MDEVTDIIEDAGSSFDKRNAAALGLAIVAGFIAAAIAKNDLDRAFKVNVNHNPKAN